MLVDGEVSQTNADDAHYDFDLFVIGAGSGGVRASRFSANFGAKVFNPGIWKINVFIFVGFVSFHSNSHLQVKSASQYSFFYGFILKGMLGCFEETFHYLILWQWIVKSTNTDSHL